MKHLEEVIINYDKKVMELERENENLKIELQDTKEHLGEFLLEEQREIQRLNKYKNFIKSIVITIEAWSQDEFGYELHDISKQELYRELYELRHEIIRGDKE